MNQTLKQMPSLRERIVEVLREHHEVKHISALADKLEAAFPAAEQISSIVPHHCSGSALVFQGGCLHVRKDGSGYIVVDENDFALEDDRCEGEHGPEGSIHWIARFPAGEMTALRDFLNGQPVSTVQDTAEEDWRNDPSRDERWNAGVDYVMKQLCTFLSVDPNNVSWDAATETLDGDVQAVIGNVLRGHFGENWGPDRRKNLDQLEIRLQELIEEDLHKARMAPNNEDLRLWFVAELISQASGRVPLLEIEGLVSRKLAAVAGGEA